MSAGSGARRGEGPGAAAGRRDTETARKVDGSTVAPQKGLEGAAKGCKVAEQSDLSGLGLVGEADLTSPKDGEWTAPAVASGTGP